MSFRDILANKPLSHPLDTITSEFRITKFEHLPAAITPVLTVEEKHCLTPLLPATITSPSLTKDSI